VRPVGAALLVLLLVGVLTRPLARRISRPVEELTAATRRFGDGDLSSRVPPPRRRSPHAPDEIEELTRAWNEMAERVERLVRGQKELLANVSHELRSPLARLRVALELLPRDDASEARVRDLEVDIAELDRLIEDVLTMSRLDAQALPLRREPVDLGALFAQIAERAALDPATARASVRVAEGSAPPALDADPALLRRALWNLVENAARYGAPPVTLSARREGGVVAISVDDEGRGIAPGDRERVFQPFFRAAGDDDRRGFGLGLALARRVAEVHGGAIRVADAPRGCTLVIEIPAA